MLKEAEERASEPWQRLLKQRKDKQIADMRELKDEKDRMVRLRSVERSKESLRETDVPRSSGKRPEVKRDRHTKRQQALSEIPVLNADTQDWIEKNALVHPTSSSEGVQRRPSGETTAPHSLQVRRVATDWKSRPRRGAFEKHAYASFCADKKTRPIRRI